MSDGRGVIGWDDWFLSMCDKVAERSKDPATNVGAVLVKDKAVISLGYNGFPSGIPEEGRWGRPTKYLFVVHGEMNALLLAAKHGTATDGSTLYSSLFPCSNCAKHIIQAGVEHVVYNADNEPRDPEDHTLSWQILEEAGVQLTGLVTYRPQIMPSLRNPFPPVCP